MIGITKKELIDFDPWQYDNQQDLLNAILKECHELDPWLTIGDAPKDRYILIFDGMARSKVVAKFDLAIGLYLDRCRVAVYASHYKELPEDPK